VFLELPSDVDEVEDEAELRTHKRVKRVSRSDQAREAPAAKFQLLRPVDTSSKKSSVDVDGRIDKLEGEWIGQQFLPPDDSNSMKACVMNVRLFLGHMYIFKHIRG